jgi:hypothetical protein
MSRQLEPWGARHDIAAASLKARPAWAARLEGFFLWPASIGYRLRRELNPYAYVANSSVKHTDPSGLAIWVCNRKAQTTPGGNHAYFWNDRNGTCCGMAGSSGSGSPTNCSEAGPPKDACRKVEGSDGFENEIFRCCQGTANAGIWFPVINDCHEAVDDCLSLLRFKNPGPPGGRTGKPCDPCQGK